MLFVGLTGGIGAGKSTVARMLAELGAVVFDADVFARTALDPGTPGHARVRERFPQVVASDGTIDRAALGRLVFADAEQRRVLESIVHPEVARLTQEAVAPYAGTDEVVVYATPLLVEKHAEATFDVVVVVMAGEDLRLERLLARGMTEGEVGKRMASQATDEERGAVADVVIDNDEGLDALERQVDRLWETLKARAARG
jgi:dephospho-CoA kinase